MKYFSYISQKTGFDISCKLSSLEKNKKTITDLLPAELAQRVKL